MQRYLATSKDVDRYIRRQRWTRRAKRAAFGLMVGCASAGSCLVVDGLGDAWLEHVAKQRDTDWVSAGAQGRTPDVPVDPRH